MADPTIDVTDAPERHRFEIRSGGDLAGFAAYRVVDDETLEFTHTEVGDAFEGQGLGSRLVAAAMAAMAERGTAVVPSCPFVARWLAEHPDHQHLVPADQRERFGLD